MSVVAYAIRVAAQCALWDRTKAQDRIYDSAVAPIDALSKEHPQPIITISTDNEAVTYEGKGYLRADRKLDLIVELAVASASVDGTGYEIPHTDEGLEQQLDYLERQVRRVFQTDEPGDLWTDLFREFTDRCETSSMRRAADAVGGIKYAARQIIFTYSPLDDPDFGVEPEGVWLRLFDAMNTDPDLAPFVPGLRAEIVGVPLEPWTLEQAALAFKRSTAANLGLGPLVPLEAPADFPEGDEAEVEVGRLP